MDRWNSSFETQRSIIKELCLFLIFRCCFNWPIADHTKIRDGKLASRVSRWRREKQRTTALSLDLSFEGTWWFVLPSIRRISDLENSLRSPDKRRVRSSGGSRFATRDTERVSRLQGTNRLPIYPPNRARQASSSFKFTPLSGVLLTLRASSIRQTKRSHSHLNLYSHVQHTRDYECVGLMKPGKASAFAPPTATTRLPPPSHTPISSTPSAISTRSSKSWLAHLRRTLLAVSFSSSSSGFVIFLPVLFTLSIFVESTNRRQP